MDLREISDAVYAGKSVEKKQAMDLAYDFINDEDAKPDKIAKYFMY